jgi:hypothetical protein
MPHRHGPHELTEGVSHLLTAPRTCMGEIPQLAAVLLAVAGPVHGRQQPCCRHCQPASRQRYWPDLDCTP